MKYPNPTFLKTASKVKHNRRKFAIILIICLCVLTAIVLFVLKMASMQRQYKKDFPNLVGAATSSTTTTEETTRKTHATTTTTTTVITEETTTELLPSFVTTTTEETTVSTEPTEQVNSPDVFKELQENFYFHNKHPLQTVSHDIRDQRLDLLKTDLENYINNCNSKERVCIYYSNLASNETMGVNELSPIVPAAAYNLPVELVFYDMCDVGTIYAYDTLTYNEDFLGNSSYIATTYTYGKQFYLRTLAYYAIALNDNTALNMLISRMGGEEFVYGKTNEISCYVNYTEDVLYTNNLNQPMKGPYRSSCYDMVNFVSELYKRYKNNPSAYQALVNDMSASALPTGFAVGFGNEALILHALGRNKDFNAYTDVAVIDGAEPVAICIYVECSSEERAQQITADLSTLVANYINGLHE